MTPDELIREAPLWADKPMKVADVAEAARRMDACFNAAPGASVAVYGARLWEARQIYRAALVRGLSGLPRRSCVVDGDTIALGQGDTIVRSSVISPDARSNANKQAKRQRGVA